MTDEHWTEELFVGHDDIFLRIHEHGWQAGEEQARDLKAIFDRFGVPPGASVLDVPCGIGRHTTRLARMGYRTVGLEATYGGWGKDPVSADRRKFILAARPSARS